MASWLGDVGRFHGDPRAGGCAPAGRRGVLRQWRADQRRRVSAAVTSSGGPGRASARRQAVRVRLITNGSLLDRKSVQRRASPGSVRPVRRSLVQARCRHASAGQASTAAALPRSGGATPGALRRAGADLGADLPVQPRRRTAAGIAICRPTSIAGAAGAEASPACISTAWRGRRCNRRRRAWRVPRPAWMEAFAGRLGACGLPVKLSP
jgi:hypothetical protein